MRVVTPRIGVVLGRGGGALAKMALPFRLRSGRAIGRRQASGPPGLHLDDLVALVEFSIATTAFRGAVNAVAPNPVTNADFPARVGGGTCIVLPSFRSPPQLSDSVGRNVSSVLGGQRVIPEAALRAGFQFRFTGVGEALRQICGLKLPR